MVVKYPTCHCNHASQLVAAVLTVKYPGSKKTTEWNSLLFCVVAGLFGQLPNLKKLYWWEAYTMIHVRHFTTTKRLSADFDPIIIHQTIATLGHCFQTQLISVIFANYFDFHNYPPRIRHDRCLVVHIENFLLKIH